MKIFYLFYFYFGFFFFGNIFAKDANKMFSMSKMFIDFVRNKGEYVLEKSGGKTQCAKDLKLLLGDLIFASKWAVESKFNIP